MVAKAQKLSFAKFENPSEKTFIYEMVIKSTGLKRISSDVFYTNPEIANFCIQAILKEIDIYKYDIIIEPSAGAGAFSDYFYKHEFNLYAYDINPQADYIQNIDFFKVDLKSLQKSQILFIGNPPFGRQSSLAKKFITRCSSFGQTIAFILPKSFRKESQQKVFPLLFHLIKELEIPPNSFLVDGNSYDVPCVFQIWDKKSTSRTTTPKAVPNGFKYVSADQKPDFSLRRVGYYAGTISEDIKKSKASHYFIKLNQEFKKDKWKESFIEKFKNHKFTHNNTVGPKSISKQEFTKVVNLILSAVVDDPTCKSEKTHMRYFLRSKS